MCGFFALYTDESAVQIAKRFGLSNIPSSFEDLEALKYFPKSTIPTISKNSPNQLVLRYWSLVPRWWKDDPFEVPFSTFNARSEDIDKKATYRTPWSNSQRCLVPSTWFYEFEKVSIQGEKKPKKIPYRVQTRDEIFTIAGLYETWKRDDKEVESVTIITCEAIPPLRNIHHRQPVIIEEKDREKWLSKETSPDEAFKLLIPTEDLQVFRISQEFNKARGKMIKYEIVEPMTINHKD